MTDELKAQTKQIQKTLVNRILTGLILVAIGTFCVFSSAWVLLSSLIGISFFICCECHHIAFQHSTLGTNERPETHKTKPLVSLLTCLFLTLITFSFIGFVFFNTVQMPLFFKICFCFFPLCFAGIELLFKRILLFRILWFLRVRIGLIAGFSLPFVYVLQSISKPLVFMALSCIFLTDTMAYFGGKCFGKTPLSSLSPKKTKEGAFMGSFCATLLGIAYCAIFKISIFYVLIFFMCSLVSQLGDLHESLFKRCFNAKDSGSFLPGHGGFYDRCDSAIIGAPFFMGCYLVLTYFGF